MEEQKQPGKLPIDFRGDFKPKPEFLNLSNAEVNAAVSDETSAIAVELLRCH
jgi:hypothetical protein